MKKNSILAAMSVLLAASIINVGCEKKAQTAANLGRPMPVEVAKPQKKLQEVWERFLVHDLAGEKSVEVRARVGGYLEKINFKDGDKVKAGDILFYIDRRPFVAVVNECEAKIKECEVRITLAKSNLERAQELIKSNAISGEVLETRKAEVLSAEAAILSAKAKLIDANLNLEFTEVRAPISGYVSKRLVDEGNLINAATTLLTTIVSRDVMYAYFYMDTKQFERFHNNGVFEVIGNKDKAPAVKLIFDNTQEIIGEGVLTYINNTVATGKIEVRAEFDNKADKIFPGTFSRVLMRSGAPAERIMLPESAIGTDLVSRFVMIVDDKNMVQYRKLVVGEVIDGMQIVLEGLTGDENVVVNGIQRAIPGKEVVPMPEGTFANAGKPASAQAQEKRE